MFNFLTKTMNNTKDSFSIKDLENLSGIKAHTIRIWEKRYNLLSPERTLTNIRHYSLESLQKLLNITLLYNSGYKISKIGKIEEKNIPILVSDIIAKHSNGSHVFNAFKLAMINFDQTLFHNTYKALLKEKTFKEIFNIIFTPFLNEMGLLWQTNTINPAHEHFISNLIRQNIIVNIEKLQTNKVTKQDKTFVLYLPKGEIHELGILYLNYELLLEGYKAIYLGQSLPIKDLKKILSYHSNINFISYFTVQPGKDKIEDYITSFTDQILANSNSNLSLMGYQTQYLDKNKLSSAVKTFDSVDELINTIKKD